MIIKDAAKYMSDVLLTSTTSDSKRVPMRPAMVGTGYHEKDRTGALSGHRQFITWPKGTVVTIRPIPPTGTRWGALPLSAYDHSQDIESFDQFTMSTVPYPEPKAPDLGERVPDRCDEMTRYLIGDDLQVEIDHGFKDISIRDLSDDSLVIVTSKVTLRRLMNLLERYQHTLIMEGK